MILTARQLNRTVLQRQLLLERVRRPALDVVEHLVGLQAQEPQDPYLALWSRVVDFDPTELSDALEQRRAARIAAMRGTVHLFTAADALALRPLAQPVLDRELKVRMFREPLEGVDLRPVLALAVEALAAGPTTMQQLRALFAERFPDLDAPALAYACRNHLALVQTPPRGLWRRGGQVRYALADRWLGGQLRAPFVEDVVRRYLAAFGPASNADIATWSRLQAIREITEGMRPSLRTHRDERGRELFDLPEAQIADPDAPAPVRVLPEYDNVLLSHDDRSRFFPSAEAKALLGSVERKVSGTVLCDGVVVGTWRVDRSTAPRRLVVDHAVVLTDAAQAEIEREVAAMIPFAAPDAAPEPGFRRLGGDA